MSIFLKFLTGVILAYISLCLLAYLGQDRLLLFPSDSGPPPHDSGLSSVSGFAGRFAGWRLDAEAGVDFRGTVFLVHGNGGDAKARLPFARRLSRLGYDAVLLEYPGYPGRSGESMRYEFFADELARDVDAIPFRGPVFLAGESFGAGVAAAMVQKGFEPEALLLLVPWNSLAELAAERLPFLPAGSLLRSPMDSSSALASVSFPVSVVLAGRDVVIPPAHGRRLAVSVGARLVELPLSGHDDWMDVDDDFLCRSLFSLRRL